MKFNLDFLFGLIAMLFFAGACNTRECKNTQPIFDRFGEETKEYKSALAEQIKIIGKENLSYWLDDYQQKEGLEFIVISVRGRDLCATMTAQVNNWDKISGIRKNPSGYRGAELQGLQFRMEQEFAEIKFIYEDVDKIID